jgi:hypothetical protein
MLAVAATVARLDAFKAEPCGQADAPPRWPVGTRVHRDPERTTVLLFLHPRCPCSAATLAECRRLLAADRLVAVSVLFRTPDGVEDACVQGANWRAARAIPGLQCLVDRGGAEARRFGALASGHVVAYAADGALLFQGGITNSRGHVGLSFGTEVILGGTAPATKTPLQAPVFGCPLDDPR